MSPEQASHPTTPTDMHFPEGTDAAYGVPASAGGGVKLLSDESASYRRGFASFSPHECGTPSNARKRMKRWLSIMGSFAVVGVASAASVELAFKYVAGDKELQPAALNHSNAAAESYSVTRLSWLIGSVAFERHDGSLCTFADHVAWLDFESARASFRISDLPAGEYRAIRFDVGIAPELNHADVSRFAAGHPLNPNLNGLHWSWQGGYVFAALEGMWRTPGAPQQGWSFHLARDSNRTTVSIPVALSGSRDVRVTFAFDVAALLQGISFAKDGSSTHSRDGDPIAAALVRNLPRTFRALDVKPLTGIHTTAAPRPLHMPKEYEPYRFTIASTFPLPKLPPDNPLIRERVELGQRLFHEPLLSRDSTIRCASCHDSAAAFSDSRRFSPGVEKRTGTRNSMPLFNLAWKSTFFWDGRSPSLRAQSLAPIRDHAEMDESLTNVVARLRRSADYRDHFARAFDSDEITAEKISLALEQFLLTLIYCDSKFDQSVRGEVSLTEQEQRGLELFMTEYDPRRGLFGADCFHCHGGPLFQAQTFANNGLDERFIDRGRGKVTGLASDDGKFAVPSLRNIELTAPYMHDGRFATLHEVVAHYSMGVKRSATLDPNLAKHPETGLQLSAADADALVAFLKTLADPAFRTNSAAVLPLLNNSAAAGNQTFTTQASYPIER